ncbi:MAG: SpoIIE family protein phosphatase [Magnetococcales bacterium]|nr:SpoIIE family protein phosphatase [Nitrospirota bacterium]
MSEGLDDLFQGDDDKQHTQSTATTGTWKVLIVDDEPGVHEVTLMILRSLVIEGRALEFISAYTGAEAMREIANNPDIALIFLDVVMEKTQAGLDVVKHIRETLNNKFVRIILRTGQPGFAPEETIIVDYDINDYREKNELNRQKLITCTVAAIRSYRDIMMISGNLRALQRLVESSRSLFDVNLIDNFFSEVLVQLNSILTLDTNTPADMYSSLLTDNSIEDLVVISGTGLYDNSQDKRVRDVVSAQTLAMIKKAFKDNNDIYTEKQAVTCLRTGNDISNLLFIDNRNGISRWDKELIDIFCAHASMYFDSVKQHKMEQSLKLSHEIQMNMLPVDFSSVGARYGVDIFAFLQPAREVGGDLYDFFGMDDDHLCIAIGDVSDKGIHAALVMSSTKVTLRAIARLYTSPETILSELNKELCTQKSGMFVTFFLGILDVRTGELTFSNAGHNPPYMLYQSTGPREMEIESGFPLGVMDDFKYIKETVSLKKGDGIFLYTDGVTDARDMKKASFTAHPLMGLLSANNGGSANQLVGSIEYALKTFIGEAPQFDDIAMLALFTNCQLSC